MKKLAFFIFVILLGVGNLRADDQIATVQQQLKDQGFYYGQVDGQPGTETTAAIRRYQIRNGLQVSGTLTQETLDSLKGAGTAGTAAAPANNAPLPPAPAPLDNQDQQQPQQTQQTPPPEQNINQSDREFLNKQQGTPATQQPPPPPPAPRQNPNIVSPPVDVSQQPQQPSSLAVQYSILFARTPYERAPYDLQVQTFKNAQAQLARQTYYNGAIDGIPGPGTAHAIMAFQADQGFAQTGRLDLNTLSALRLLPNAAPQPRRVIVQPFYPPPRYEQPPRVYRGIWVN